MRNDTQRLHRVAVTGASGIVGQFVVRRLLQEGIRVRAGSRQPPATSDATASVEWCPFSLDSVAPAKDLLDGCDALVHCAFAHTPGRYRGGEGGHPEAFWSLNLGGTSRLLDACVEHGVARAVVFSSRAVFGVSEGTEAARRVCDDNDLPTPSTHYGALKRAEESMLRLAARNTPLLAASLRPTGIYGVLSQPQQSKWYADCRAVHQGQPIARVRSGTEVHGNDVADAVWRLLSGPAEHMRGQAYNCSDQLVSTRMLARELNALSGQSLPLPGVTDAPSPLMRCSGLRQLGWVPGGKQRLRETLQLLMNKLAD